MKQARAKAQQPKEVVEDDPEMQMGEQKAQKKTDGATDNNYVVEYYNYDMDKEIAAFHSIFSKWSVGGIEHVYYIPDFVTAEEEDALLLNVRIAALSHLFQIS